MEHDTKFYKFVEYIETNRKRVAIGIFTLCLLAALWIAFEQRAPLIEYFITDAQQQVVDDQQFRELVRVNSLIQSRLDTFRESVDASRVAVRRFHNGRHDLTTVPFEKVTDVYTSHDEDFDLYVDVDRTLPLSALTYTLSNIWGANASDPKCFGQETANYPRGAHRAFFVQHGIAYTYTCPVVNIAKYPLGVIAVNLPFVPTQDQEAVIAVRTKATADTISGYLELISEIKSK